MDDQSTVIVDKRVIELEASLTAVSEMLDNVTASLESVMAHFGSQMPCSDQRYRNRLVEEAREMADYQLGRKKPKPT